jgi:hypothetical protein
LNAIVHFHEFTSLVKRRARSLPRPEPEDGANAAPKLSSQLEASTTIEVFLYELPRWNAAALRDRGIRWRKCRTRDVLSHLCNG